MYFKRLAAGLVVGAFLIPIAASAQSINLSIQARQQLLSLATQLVQILNELAQARAYGPAYLATAEFAQKGVAWLGQLSSIQQQVSMIIASAGPFPTAPYPPTYPGAGSGVCPSLSRDLEPGMYGSDVASLQQFFAREASARYVGPIDGAYSPAVVDAVQRFQSANGVIYYGDWNTTGYGRVGPATRAAIARVCATMSWSPTFPAPTPQPPAANSTGTLTRKSVSGQDANTITFIITANPTASCSATQFTLLFGDGEEKVVTFPASCNTQTQDVTHTYRSLGSYTATLKSGTFQSGISVAAAPSNYTLALSAAQGSASYAVDLTATYNPGARCDATDYTLYWGDGTDRLITFSGVNCAAQTKTYSHTYPQEGTYVIRATDSRGSETSISVVAVFVPAAGAGDPNAVLKITGDGGIVDSSPLARSLSVNGVSVDASVKKVGSGSLMFNGGSSLSAASSPDFNFGASSFTVSFWFRPQAFPASDSQAGLLVQANTQATDASLGGAGLELFGTKLAFVGRIGGVTYHPFYNNTLISSALTANTWYHAALVRNGNTLTLYLNGVSQGAFGVSGSTNASTNALTLGRYGEYGGNYFNGWMDEVLVEKNKARWTANFDPNVSGGSGGRVIFLTSGTSWTVPSDWTTSNTIEVIGGGGGGGSGGAHFNGGASGGGGGGGAYSKITNIPLTPGTTISYSVGIGGSAASGGGDTYFCNSSSNCSSISGSSVVVGAKGGAGGGNASGQNGGASGGGADGSGVGSTKYSGGAGRAGLVTGLGHAGGGGAAGPNGAGGSGGGGGGGANGGSGALNDNGSGGSGGNGRSGSGGAAAGNPGNAGSNGGGGGSGINGNQSAANLAGGAGGAGTEWDSTHGSGGGGGGGAYNDAVANQPTGNGGNGGGYGGGGGAGSGSQGSGTPGTGGSGAQGIIVITY